MGSRRPGNRWYLLLAAIFAVYVTVLLVNAFRSQDQLRTEAEARLVAESRQTAGVLADLLQDQRNFALGLAQSREIETFLTNKALGMSMRYGLNVNLAAIEEFFHARLAQKKVLGLPAYRRILFLDEQGNVLVATGPDLPPLPDAPLPGATGKLVIDNIQNRIITRFPVDYRGMPGGTVVTVADLDLLSRFLATSASDMGFRQYLIDQAGWPLGNATHPAYPRGIDAAALAALPDGQLVPLDKIPGLGGGALAEDFDLILRTPISGVSLSLITVSPESTIYGHITSRQFLYLASILPLAILVVALWLQRMRLHTRKLEADVVESNRNHAELLGRNDALTEEITRREAVESVLRESEERYRNLTENSSDWIWAMDLEGRHVYSNGKGMAILGWDNEIFASHGAADFVYPDDQALFRETVKKAIDTRGGWRSVPIRWRRKQGGYRAMESSASPAFDGEGRLIGFQGVDRDVTERLAVEAELEKYRLQLERLVEDRTRELREAKEAAEAANVTKSAFLANMSHEIRTPLNAITGLSQLIRRSGVTQEQTLWLNRMEAAGSHLLEVINAILDLSKIEAGKFELSEDDVHLDSIAGNVASMIQGRLQDRHLRLVMDVKPIAYALRGDPIRLRQALLNYATNAVKFTATGGITVRIEPVEETADTVLIRFEVRDTGIGIEQEALGRLFNAFEQADNSPTRRYEGTGLGLAITRKFAQLMGGDAGATSVPGMGSTFWFTARLKKYDQPLARQPKAGGGAEALLRGAYAGRRILLVEDEATNQEIATMFLGDVDLAVDLAEDGVRAVEAASGQAYDLILMDMQMPNMDGLEATRRIRRLPAHARTPIVAMTANAFEEDRRRCFDVGMNDFLSKPVKTEELYAVILHWLEQPPG